MEDCLSRVYWVPIYRKIKVVRLCSTAIRVLDYCKGYLLATAIIKGIGNCTDCILGYCKVLV